MEQIEKIKAGTNESRETSGIVNYVELFKERLDNIKPIHGSESMLSAYDFEQVGIKDAKKLAPALIIEMEDGELEMWLGEPGDILLNSPTGIHQELERNLYRFIDQNNGKSPVGLGISAFVLQDKKEITHLFFEERGTRVAKLEIDRGNEERKWANFILRYNIGDLLGTDFRIQAGISGEKSVVVHSLLDLEIMGKLRKNITLAKIAQLESMSSTQICRFWAYATASGPPIQNYTFEKAFKLATGKNMKPETEEMILGKRKR